MKPPAALTRILVIPLRYIGDTILSVPLLRNLAQQFPEAKIDVLTSATTAPLLEPCPYVNQVLIEPKSSLARLRLLKAGQYDAVFILRKSVSMALLCRLAGIPLVVGYDKQRFPWGYRRTGWLLDYAARYPNLKTTVPQAVSHLGLLNVCGLTVSEDTRLELWATAADQAKVSTLLSDAGIADKTPLAAVHLASASHGKMIAVEKFAESIRQLHAAGYQVVCTGTAGDTSLYQRLHELTGVPLLNLAGKTTLQETYALYTRLRLLLTVDSSPIHLGAAAGVPSIVGAFGPTNEKQWGPHNPNTAFHPVFVDLPCRPCYAKVCSHNNCRVTMTDTQIAEATRAAIAADTRH